jgi:hypothetical protein
MTHHSSRIHPASLITHHSIFKFASFTTFVHLAISARKKTMNSSGVLMTYSFPAFASRSHRTLPASATQSTRSFSAVEDIKLFARRSSSSGRDPGRGVP